VRWRCGEFHIKQPDGGALGGVVAGKVRQVNAWGSEYDEGVIGRKDLELQLNRGGLRSQTEVSL
jgi:hypothetical protein